MHFGSSDLQFLKSQQKLDGFNFFLDLKVELQKCNRRRSEERRGAGGEVDLCLW